MVVTDFAISHKAAVFVLTLILLIGGAWCYVSLPREAAPDINIPYVIVSTSYPGVSPADVENQVTIEIEKKLKTLNDVEKVTSTSAEGASTVIVEFDPKVDITDARQRVRDKVDEARSKMPSDVEEPSVEEINLSEMPIMNVSIAGPVGLVRLKGLAEDLEDDIEVIPGVLAATVVGGREREIRIEVDMDRLQVYDFPLVHLLSLIERENVNVSGGAVESGLAKFSVRVPAEFGDPAEIFRLILFVRDGKPVYLTDVARVVDDFKDETTRSRINGEESVTLVIQKRSGENVVRIADDIKRLVAAKQRRVPAGVTYHLNFDQSEQIRTLVSDLENNIISGVLLVVGVLFIFISARNSILIAMAIPLSFCIGFIVLSALGVTLNMVVLFSLVLAVGMLVDNAIVIVENIYRHANEGLERTEAARVASAEVAWPVITSALTTVAAFATLLFWRGIIGTFMGFLPKTVCILLAGSLFVALVINPTLCASFLKVTRRRGGTGSDPSAPKKSVIIRVYEAILGASLRARFVVIAATVLVYIAVVAIYASRNLGVAFFPRSEPSRIMIAVKMPEGSSLEATDRVLREVERAIEVEMHRKEQMLGELEALFRKNGVWDEATTAEVGRLAEDLRGRKERLAGGLIALAVGRGAKREAFEADLRDVVARYNAGLDDIKFYVTSAGHRAGSVFSMGATTVNVGSVDVDFVDRELRLKSSSEIIRHIRERIAGLHGGEVEVEEQEHGPPQEKPVNIEVSGADLDLIAEIAEEVKRVVKTVAGVVDLRDDYDEGRPELRFYVDRQRAALAGLSSDTVAQTLKVAVLGLKVGTYREADEDYDITLRFPEEQRNDLNSVLRIRIPDNAGNQVPLSSVARLSYEAGEGSITRKDEKRTITVYSDVLPGYNSTKVLEEVRRRLSGVERRLPGGYKLAYTGQREEQDKAARFLFRSFFIAVAAIALILILEFNSYSLPFIIMLSVALSIMGVFIGLLVLGQPFGIIMNGVAVISLAGVAVNNAIVLIDYTERLRRKGLSLRQAVIKAGATRLRPVMLTAVTTVLGLLPMAVGVSVDFRRMLMDLARRDLAGWRLWVVTGSESAQWWSSMATSIIFGLMIATFLTLVVVPVLYSLFTQVRFRLKSLDEVAPDC
ncbi:MAG: efflux RND transporter permease subunit [Planctomycetota bacterium]